MREAHISTQQSQAEEDPRVSVAHAHARWTSGAEESAPARPQAPLRLIARVRDRATFEALAGVRPVRRGPLSLRCVLDATASAPPRARVAYAVGGVGGAVARNRARRRLRAAVRGETGRLVSGAYLFGAGRDAVTAPFDVLQQSVRELLDDVLRAK